MLIILSISNQPFECMNFLEYQITVSISKLFPDFPATLPKLKYPTKLYKKHLNLRNDKKASRLGIRGTLKTS